MIALKNRREGFAIVGAVLAMLVVGVVVTGGFYAANQQSQIARSTHLGDLAQYIAETGLEATMGNTTAKTLDTMTVNTTMTVYSGTAVQYGGRTVGNYTSRITRTTGTLFIVRSTGQVTIGGPNAGATRTVANVVRLRVADFDNQTAMQVFGDLTVSGTADIEGTDQFQSEWSGENCSTSTSSAVTAQPGAQVKEQGSGDIDGTITRQQMDSTHFTVFGDLTWDDVVGMATRVYAPGTTISQILPNCTPASCAAGSVCNINVLNNWGDPLRPTSPCFTHFPIIYGEGNLSISANGSGQGILLVEGDLRITSQFQFFGPVVVKGSLDVGAGGSNIVGSIYAFGGGNVGDDSNVGGNAVVQYSSCSIKRAVMGAQGMSRGIPIRHRSWFDLTTVQNSY